MSKEIPSKDELKNAATFSGFLLLAKNRGQQ